MKLTCLRVDLANLLPTVYDTTAAAAATGQQQISRTSLYRNPLARRNIAFLRQVTYPVDGDDLPIKGAANSHIARVPVDAEHTNRVFVCTHASQTKCVAITQFICGMFNMMNPAGKRKGDGAGKKSRKKGKKKTEGSELML